MSIHCFCCCFFSLLLIHFRFSLVAHLFLLFTFRSSMKEFVHSLISWLFSPLLFVRRSSISSFRSLLFCEKTQVLNASHIHYFLRKFKAQTSMYIYIYIYTHIYIYIYIYTHIGWNKTNTFKLLIVSCFHIYQAYTITLTRSTNYIIILSQQNLNCYHIF